MINELNDKDINFLKKINCNIDKQNQDTLLFIKNYFLPEKNNSQYDEKHLYTMLFLEGYNNPNNSKYSQLGEKLCGKYQDNNNQKNTLTSRLLVLGYLKEVNENKKISNEERIKNLEAIKQKLLEQKNGFINLIQNDNISKEYKKIIIERALKYNLTEPQKQTVINMSYEKAPSLNYNTRLSGRVR